jgi:hypothetical protein
MLRKFVAFMSLVVLIFSPGAVQGQEGEDGDSEKSVNVELILDVSGSMAQQLDTGETRMEAAKQVLRTVVEAIPEREGVNVGLRIYGFVGDSTEETKERSCKSSDLVVPLDGVDREALINEVEALEPTGWTPLTLSLQRAEKDFDPAEEDVTNAIVLITDGLETCDGDPCDAAGDIASREAEISTHVIGFALTAEEQDTIACIAEEGNGQLFGAGSAAELSEALFSVLEELEIVTGTGYIGGNAFSLVPAGESGELSVVAYGSPDPSVSFLGMPVVVRNNTGEDVAGVNLSATARDSGGGLLGAGNALFVSPFEIVSGGLAIATIHFGGATLPADAEFEFNIEPLDSSEARFRSERDLDIVEAELFEDRIVGTLENPHEDDVAGPITVGAVCFDTEGTVLSYDIGTIEVGSLASGDTASFQVSILGFLISGQGCPAFLVTGYGYAQ